MIIHRYLAREIFAALAGVSVLLLLIFLSSTFVRILADASEGKFPAAVVLSVFGYKALSSLVVIVQLSFFLAIMVALGRLYRDNEMTVMVACGVSPWRVFTLIGVLGLFMGILSAGMSLYLGPWAEDRHQSVLDRAAAATEIEGIAAGRFNQASEGENLVYVEALSGDRTRMRNVFVHSRQENGQSVVLTAKSGYQEDDPETGARYLILVDGYRYDGIPGHRDFRTVRFEEHALRIQAREVTESERRRKAQPTAKLWGEKAPGARAEFQRRVSIAIASFVLAILAVPLSKTNPRQGRYAKLFVAIMIYIIYSNMLTVAETWVAKGRIDPRLGMWWVHAVMASVALVHVAWQNGTFRRRTKARGTAA